jgi:hypothetical protein
MLLGLFLFLGEERRRGDRRGGDEERNFFLLSYAISLKYAIGCR